MHAAGAVSTATQEVRLAALSLASSAAAGEKLKLVLGAALFRVCRSGRELPLLLNLRPGVAQAYGAVENQMPRRAVLIHAEVAMAQELQPGARFGIVE